MDYFFAFWRKDLLYRRLKLRLEPLDLNLVKKLFQIWHLCRNCLARFPFTRNSITFHRFWLWIKEVDRPLVKLTNKIRYCCGFLQILLFKVLLWCNLALKWMCFYRSKTLDPWQTIFPPRIPDLSWDAFPRIWSLGDPKHPRDEFFLDGTWDSYNVENLSQTGQK